MREYDQIAAWYARVRNPGISIPDVVAFGQTLPPGANVLDIGCGNGVPITQRLVQDGFGVVALDSSTEMIARLRVNCPSVATRCERIEDAAFAPGSFDGIVAWGVLFHLEGADQQTVIERAAGWMKPGGRLLFTSGGAAGVGDGTMDDVAFRYVSLGAATYRRLLERVGLRMDEDYRDAWDNHVYLATKPA